MQHFVTDKILNTIAEMKDCWQYRNFTIEDVLVTEDADNVCVSIKGQEHKEAKEDFQTAYVNNIKVDVDTAIALNTASLLDNAEIKFNETGRYF